MDWDLRPEHCQFTRYEIPTCEFAGRHRIFFAVPAWAVEEEHKELKKLLEIDRDPYREEFERAGGDKWRTVFASTRNPNIISQIFADYEFYYGGLAQYPFIVAKGELDVWMDSLRKT